MDSELHQVDRRTALKWMAATVVLFPALEWRGLGQTRAAGTLSDPDLIKPQVLWSRILSKEQLVAVASLCDVIIPEDSQSPSASKLGVHEFIDEWVSAPFPVQKEDRELILKGLKWLDEESRKRFTKPFSSLDEPQKSAICDEICWVEKAGAEQKLAAEFFAKMRDLTSSAFYTTKEGMKDLQYVGNVALTTFSGPPPEVLKYLKLE